MASTGALQAIRYSRGRLELLDQRQLPLQTHFVPVASLAACHAAIKDMVVRGAPAIAIAAALALAVELEVGGSERFRDGGEASAHVAASLDYLVTSRPTAVNLAEIALRLNRVAGRHVDEGAAAVVAAIVLAAEQELETDVSTNRAIGRHGAEALAAHSRGDAGVRVLTHCNTGSLATAGYGTALGVVRALSESGRLAAVFATETRPYLQGARLTAYELVQDGLGPATLICDSAAAALMAQGQVHAVVVGADRVAANGDTANKIGTYALAVAAHHHSVPFYVAAPRTTLDGTTADGSCIHIEQRAAEEVTHARDGSRVAAAGIAVWNPSFDVTPARLITGIITETGVIRRAAGSETFNIVAHLSSSDAPAAAAAPLVLDTSRILDYVAVRPELAQRLGGVSTRGQWSAREIGDGNINFVYLLEGPDGAMVLKQALPFIRLVGERWPLSQERIRFEAASLQEQRRWCPQHVPELYYWSEGDSVIAMRYIQPPHVTLRGALVRGAVFPALAGHLGEFLAATLFHTSALALGGAAFRAAASSFANVHMCALTEQVVFSSPFYACPDNRHTSPQLDRHAAALRCDAPAKAAAAQLKRAFLGCSQALLHGDLHTGSLMVCDSSSFVFDSEFAFYGPMGFDVGALLGNLLLAYFASDGQEGVVGGEGRAAQRAWLLSCVRDTWRVFSERFQTLWSAAVVEGRAGELTPSVRSLCLFEPHSERHCHIVA
jgi:5-methylthioribose kinase